MKEQKKKRKKKFNQSISHFDKISSALVPDNGNVLEKEVLRTKVL